MGFFLPLLLLTATVQERVLPNGMRVILKEDHSAPLVDVTVVVKSGAVYEADSTLGMTHFLEHLLFDGTETQTREQIRDRFDERGIYFNAFTRHDFTAYLINGPSEFIDDGIRNQADMLMHSILPEHELEKERQVVIEEMHKDRARPSEVADELFRSIAYAGTPYAKPVLGYEEQILRVKRGTVYRYYKAFYRPDNMIAIVIGDFDPDHIVKVLEDAYGPSPDTPLPPAPEIPPFQPEGTRVVQKTWQFPSTYLMVALPALPPDDPRAPALEVLVELLNSEGDSPFLQQVVAGDHPLAVEAYFSYEKHLGLNTLQLTAKPNSPADARRILQILQNTLSDLSWITDDMVRRTRTALVADHYFTTESFTYEGMYLAYWVALGGSYDLYQRFYDGIRQVSRDQVLAAGQAVFQPLRYVAVIVGPGGAR